MNLDQNYQIELISIDPAIGYEHEKNMNMEGVELISISSRAYQN